MKVFSLITVRNPDLFESCTLALQSLRTGFPTSRITVLINGNCPMQKEVVEKCKYFGLDYYEHERRMFHADWIEEIITTQASQALNGADHDFVISDGDCIFWQSCEHMMPPASIPWKGYYIPEHQNEWSGTWAMDRIHPSLVFGHADIIMKELKEKYPMAYAEDREYCGWRPFHPVSVASNGIIHFCDTLSVAWNTIGGQRFCHAEKDCYDHLNSASFYDTIIKRFDSDEVRQAFAKVHEIATKGGSDLAQLRGMWQNIDRYYENRF